MKQLIKQVFLPKGRKLRQLKGGLAKGMWMELDLLTQFQRYWGIYERELITPFKRLIPYCKSLVDVGANDGYYTMAFLQSGAERVVACEPCTIRERLLTNAQANGYQPSERFIVEHRFIGQGEEWLAIAELIQSLPRPILLKVDIEGSEINLLQSVEAYPFLSELYWVIETHSQDLEKQCIKWLISHSYHTKIIYNAPWRVLLPEQRSIHHNRWLIAEPFHSHF